MQERRVLEEALGPMPGFWHRALVLPGQRTLRLARRKPLGAVAAVVILIVILMAVFAEAVAPYGPTDVLIGPSMAGPTRSHIMGTDQTGRDMFSRIVFGARVSLWVGIIAVAIGVGSGTIIGLVSGYTGGKLADTLLQRLMDAIFAFPALVLAMAVISVLGASTTNVMAAIGIAIMPGISRVVRGSVLTTKQNQYVEAAQVIGCSGARIMVRHILPNVAAPIIILATLQLGNAILAEAALSFLGLGTQPPNPSWGRMLSGDGRIYMEQAPWLAVFPGLAITITVLAFNLLGDTIRDVLDPRLRGT